MSNKKWITLLGQKGKPRKFYRFMRSMKKAQAERGEFAITKRFDNIFAKSSNVPE